MPGYLAAWDICPGDFVELEDGRRGTVLSTASLFDGTMFAVEVGFDWYDISSVVSWTPEYQ